MTTRWFDRSRYREQSEYWSAASIHGMACSAHYLASGAGAEVLHANGNAFDAAIAISLALSVCEPAGSGLGGMGMMVGYDARASRVFALAAPCRAPRLATSEAIKTANRYRGHAAVATPALCALLHHLHVHYGSCPRDVVAAGALALARDGFEVTSTLATLLGQYARALGGGEGLAPFFENSKAVAAGTRVRQPLLHAALDSLVRDGFDTFYTGDIGRSIDVDMRLNGGFVRSTDLESMLDLQETIPLAVPFDEGVAWTVGPPAGGLNLLQLLGMAGRLPHEVLDLRTPAGAVAVAKCIRQVRRDRTRYRLKIGAESPLAAAHLNTPEGLDDAITAAGLGEAGETSHFCVADRAGNWVSMTQSVERSFGAGLGAPDLGFVYNGYLRGFKIENRRHPHYLQPGVAARSNAAPTLIVKDAGVIAAVGSTGSERMQSGIFEVLLRLRHSEPFAAVAAPRLHATPEGRVLLEQARFDAATLAALNDAGFDLEDVGAYAFSMGGLQLLTRQGREFVGVGEPRRDGLAVAV